MSTRSHAVLLALLLSVLSVPGADFTMKVTESEFLARGLISAINEVRRFPLMPVEAIYGLTLKRCDAFILAAYASLSRKGDCHETIAALPYSPLRSIAVRRRLLEGKRSESMEQR
jgi:hypothetical protein